MKIQSEWFEKQIVSRYGSQRKFCKLLDGRKGEQMDPSALTRTLNGERELSLREATQMARLLGVTVDELAMRMGL